MEIYVYTHSGIGMDQAILYGSGSGQARKFELELNHGEKGTMSQKDLYSAFLLLFLNTMIRC
jgi:hypothetical protein